MYPTSSQGISWIKYDDTKVAQESKRMVGTILEHGALLTILQKIQTNLNFKKTTLAKTVECVMDSNGEGWGLKGKHKSDYTETLSRRLVNMCRHVNQGLSHRSPPKWTYELPWMKTKSSSSSSSSTNIIAKKNVADGGDKEYVYGYVRELRVAYRKTGKKGEQELSLPLEIETGAGPLEMPIARWPDGSMWKVSAITVGDLQKAA